MVNLLRVQHWSSAHCHFCFVHKCTQYLQTHLQMHYKSHGAGKSQHQHAWNSNYEECVSHPANTIRMSTSIKIGVYQDEVSHPSLSSIPTLAVVKLDLNGGGCEPSKDILQRCNCQTKMIQVGTPLYPECFPIFVRDRDVVYVLIECLDTLV